MYQSTTIGLPVRNLEASMIWYRQLLGNVEEIEPDVGIKELKLNDVTWLQLYEAETGFGGNNVLRIEVADVAAIHAKVVGLGSAPPDMVEVPNVIKVFDFTDPSQNQLSFYELL